MTVTTQMAPDNAGATASGADDRTTNTHEGETITMNATEPTAETVEKRCTEYDWCTQDHSHPEATFHEKEFEIGTLRGWFYPADGDSPARVHYMECLDWSLDTLDEIQEVADDWLKVKAEFAAFVAEVTK